MLFMDPTHCFIYPPFSTVCRLYKTRIQLLNRQIQTIESSEDPRVGSILRTLEVRRDKALGALKERLSCELGSIKQRFQTEIAQIDYEWKVSILFTVLMSISHPLRGLLYKLSICV